MKKHFALIFLVLASTILKAELSQSLAGADSLKIGSRFELFLVADKSLSKATIPDTLEAFTVLSQEVISQVGRPASLKLKIMPLQLGALTFPQLSVSAEDGSLYQSDRFRVNVLSVRAPGDTLLRDITAPKRYAWELSWYIYLLLFVIAIILIIVIIYRLLRKPKALPVQDKFEPKESVPNWKQALLELQKLLDSDLIERGEITEFHFRLAQILRSFMEAEYHIKAVEMTTFEIREALRTAKLKIPSENETIGFLTACDRIKFAKHSPHLTEIDMRIEWLKKYLIQTSEETHSNDSNL